MATTFIIEHLEKELWPWCLIEYENISKIVGKDSLWFTNIKPKDTNKLKRFGKVFTESVKDMGLEDVCVLDPETPKVLTPDDGKRFKYFVFGGILGDYPPKKRTKAELTRFLPNAAVRHIGKEQFPTDNAVFVVKKIVDGAELKDFKFKDKIEIKIDKFASIELPFRYALVGGKPFICKKIVDYLKKKTDF